MRARYERILFVIVAAALAILTHATPTRAQFMVPTNFVDEPVITGLNQPVGMTFLPDGRLLIVEQVTANIRLVVRGAFATPDPLLTVANVRTAGNEQGLLGIAVDPGWPGRPYIYVHYDYSGDSHIRVSRFTVGGDVSFTGTGDLTINPATRYDILIDIPDFQTNHNGGTLCFGPDGRLYDSAGDDATSCNAQDLTSLAGKILRLDVSGLQAGGGGPPAKSLITPADNPYVSNADPNARLVGFFGLRNPFRFHIDRLNGAFAIGDVGENTVEEIDYVPAAPLGANFEWPSYEGNITGPQVCSGTDASRFTDPVYTYTHAIGDAVIGGPIYHAPPGATSPFPPEYEGDIFFCDFYSAWLHRLKNSGGTWALASAPGQPNAGDWANGASNVSDWAVGPDGSIYYCELGAGAIRRIRYDDTASVAVPPVAMRLDFRAPYPSPANTQVSFDYQLPNDARVALSVFDMRGREVWTRDVGVQSAGPRSRVWNLRDKNGRFVPAGVYVARLTVGVAHAERRFTVIRRDIVVSTAN